MQPSVSNTLSSAPAGIWSLLGYCIPPFPLRKDTGGLCYKQGGSGRSCRSNKSFTWIRCWKSFSLMIGVKIWAYIINVAKAATKMSLEQPVYIPFLQPHGIIGGLGTHLGCCSNSQMMVDACLQSKMYNLSQDICHFKDWKVQVAGFRTQKNEATIPGTGICFIERAADMPEDDLRQCGKAMVLKMWSLGTRVSHQWAQFHTLDQEYHCRTFKAKWLCKGRKVCC